MAERSRSEYGLSLASGYYGTLLFGAGLLSAPGVVPPGAGVRPALAGRGGRGHCPERLGTNALFANERRGACSGEEAMALLRQVGERWEVQTA